MSLIRNTTEDMKDPTNALGFLIAGMGGDPSAAIYAQEKAGQTQVVNSDRMPSDCHDRAALEALGFTFGDPDPSDPMFMPATLPPGWARAATDHSMHSEIRDERGIARVGIFYKAAFYDRSAHTYLIGVGHSAATKALYGDDAPALPALWAVFTDAERDDFRAGIAQMVERAAESPTIYGKYLPRVEVIQSLLVEATAAGE